MKIKKLNRIITKFIKLMISKSKTPYAVSWVLTYRCNLRCRYCGVHQNISEELNTEEIISIIDILAKLGTCFVSFTGGEPLLRDDIGDIITYASKKSIYVSLNSNGILIPKKISIIKDVDRINLSFDGSENIHDSIRGKFSQKKVFAAIKQAQLNKINVSLTTVLTKLNINVLDYILRMAKELNVNIMFQPATKTLLGTNEKNFLSPSRDEYVSSIEKLIREKNKKNNKITNSKSGLKHLMNWPNPKSIKCSAGFLHYRIEPDGHIIACPRFYILNKKIDKNYNLKGISLKDAIDNIPKAGCKTCWCGAAVELNYLLSMEPSAIAEGVSKIFFNHY